MVIIEHLLNSTYVSDIILNVLKSPSQRAAQCNRLFFQYSFPVEAIEH